MDHKLKICVYTTNRAEYSKLRPILKLLHLDPDIELSLLVTGSHLLKQYGESKNQIIKDGLQITEEIYTHIAGDDVSKTVETIGIGLLKLPSIFKKINPDIILCGFDRFDMYPFAITASLMNYCLVHIEGGEITGTLDEKIRHSISKLANYHLVSTNQAKNNLIKMGEFSENVFVTGCPRYDELLNISKDNTIVLDNYNVTKKNFYIFCYHPVSSNIEYSYNEWKILLETIIELKENIIFIKPNIDYGNEKLIELFNELNIFNIPYIYVYNHIDIDNFSILLKNCNILIGNSSAGIREACVFGTPVINIGTRQQYRILDILENVHNMINFDKNQLINRIKQIKSITYKQNLVFGNGNASYNIVNIIKNINYNNTEKVISYYK
tara:strand:+ start:129 stop:1274 length:1146 start_codon:yes stop_codon:yes gene_type:complete